MFNITIRSLDGGQFGGYVASPKSTGRSPALIVLHEIFGVNETMRQLCDDFASQGYLAVCPDLYWRQEPGVQLSDRTNAEWEHSFSLYKNCDVEACVRDLLATLAHVRLMPACNGKVGTIGYCLGGRLVWLFAARSDVDCSVSYYGAGIDNMLDEIYDIRMPMVMHIAGNDKFVSPDTRQKIVSALPKNPAINAYIYEGAEHAFARPGGSSYHPEAAALANERTQAFLADRLK